MTENEKKVPGVKVWLDGCEQRGSVMTPGAINFTMSIGGTCESEEIFQKLKVKLNEGLTIATSDDLRGIMLKSLREDNTFLEQKVRELEMQLLNERKEKLAIKEQMSRGNTLDFLKRRGNI